MRGRRGRLGRRLQGQAVLARRKDVLDGLIAVGADGDGAGTGGVEPRGAVLSAQTHDPQTGAIALFRVRPALQDFGDEPSRGRPGLLGPANEPRRRHSACARWALGMCSGLVEGCPS